MGNSFFIISMSNPLFLIPALTGGIFFLVGLIMKYFPPKEINGLYGYRTNRSMKNKTAWDFAQKYAAAQMLVFGTLLMLFSVLGFYFTLGEETALVIGLGEMLLATLIMIARVEHKLKVKFGDHK